ncbi:carbonic anhydrase [Sulfurovum mangrovi]|uniref:carbonic anhydrase n=1 Tax=Sulfurovum mangrovi TaxID=2893889 RepID=UPI001E326552|nr:carbonic anhydrase [Sulfurovum mangrovi]UFH59536.1 carbonic anhydrase [Sulfurovum mangrovi]UFH60681.1 carbonic anhydrase [Sulfurovum mangrovi]
MDMAELIEGNLAFQNASFKLFKEDYEALVKHGQAPEVLFIGCSDSRVVPDLILHSKPGDMFILRNIGNFVPPFKADNEFHGSAAVIEYAVSILNVKHIIICGHSHCGACQALYQEFDDDIGLIHIRKWLELGAKAKAEVLKKYSQTLNQEELYRKTEKVSILYQLQNLLTYPEVKKRIEEKKLEIHGWYYRIEDGMIETYNKTKKCFERMN